MTKKAIFPVTCLNHENQLKLQNFLQKYFAHPHPEKMGGELVAFLEKCPLPLTDLPYVEGTYTRTVLFRSESGFEAMAARWSKGAFSSIHGHPYFNLYFVMHGRLHIDDYIRSGDGLVLTSSETITANGGSSFIGNKGTFDNNIHQVHAIEETLSIHISSDDSTKGEVFS